MQAPAVVRLGIGSGSNQQDLISWGPQKYRIKQGQALSLQFISSTIATVRAWARVRYDNGEDSLLFIPDFVATADPIEPTLAEPGDAARLDGWVVDALVELPNDLDVERGQVYVKLFMYPFGPTLCSDYCYSSFGQVALGTYKVAGPAGGAGFLEVVTLSPEGVPVAEFTHVFASLVAGVVRKIHGFVWYYIASADVASRELSSELKNPLGAFATGMDRLTVFDIPKVTLTASQQGTVFADEKRSGSIDHTVLTIESAAANPSPFPFFALFGDPYNLVLTAASLHANDLDVMYLKRESWVVGLF